MPTAVARSTSMRKHESRTSERHKQRIVQIILPVDGQNSKVRMQRGPDGCLVSHAR